MYAVKTVNRLNDAYNPIRRYLGKMSKIEMVISMAGTNHAIKPAMDVRIGDCPS
jgi:hypothetical protein